MAATAVQVVRNYVALTKPRILLLVIFTALPALVMAGEGWPDAGFACATLLGIALASGAANALNCYIERDRDALMERTRTRPLPSGALRPEAALAFGLMLCVVSTALLLAVAGPIAAALGVASILFYVFIYTVWLKPRSAWNAVVGGGYRFNERWSALGAYRVLSNDVEQDGFKWDVDYSGLALAVGYTF